MQGIVLCLNDIAGIFFLKGGLIRMSLCFSCMRYLKSKYIGFCLSELIFRPFDYFNSLNGYNRFAIPLSDVLC